MEGHKNAKEVHNPQARLEASVADFATWFRKAELTPEAAGEVREKVERSSSILLRAARQVGLIIAMAEPTLYVVNHEATRYEVTEEPGKGNEKLYTHSDAETTAILNWLSGKTDLPLDLQADMFRDFVRAVCIGRKAEVPTDLDTKDVPAMKKFLSTMYSTDKWHYAGELSAEKSAEFGFYDYVKSFEYNPKLYEALWQTEKKNGAPRIRFTFQGDRTFREEQKSHGHDAWYSPISNTMYINPSSAFKTYLAELAHSKQEEDNPVAADARGLIDQAAVLYRMLDEKESYADSYNQTYNMPGTIENEAHFVIEPAFEKSFEDKQPKEKPNPVLKDIPRYHGR